MMRKTALLSCGVLLLGCLLPMNLRADPQSDSAIDSLKKLAGKWVSSDNTPHKDKQGKDMKGTTEFKVTSGGSVVMETMCAGTEYEMINMYHEDGDSVVMTHYCAMGNQPTMALKKVENGSLVFEFRNGSNLKSREEPHMDQLTVTVDGDKLTEDWGFYKDGKIDSREQFHFTRQQEQK